MSPLDALLYFLLGLAASTYGTLIGAGGGFLIVPVLILLFGYDPAIAAGTSLSVVFLNGIASTYLYSRQGRIDFRTGLLLAVATIPGAIGGAYVVAGLDRRAFGLVFGLLMVAVALFLLFRPPNQNLALPLGTTTRLPWLWHRTFVDARGDRFEYAFNPVAAFAICLVIGFLSSLLGIGGGIMLTPTLILMFGVPAHVAAATSQVVLLVSSGFGALSHFTLGHINFPAAIPMGVGGLLGSRLGSMIALRVRGTTVTRALAIALLGVGVRLAIG